MSYREDFIKRLISQFFQALYKIMGFIKKEDYSSAKAMISELRAELLGISQNMADTLSTPDLISMLSTGEEPDLGKPLILAELFKTEGDIYAAEENEEKAYQQYLKALDMQLELAFQTGDTRIPEEFTPVDSIADLLEDYVLPPETLAALFHYYEAANQFARAEEILFDFIEDSPNPAEVVASGFRFVDRLHAKSADELLAGELAPEDIDDIAEELHKVQKSLDK